MIAIGAGGLDVAVCMAGHPSSFRAPRSSASISRTSLARPWIQAKDIILEPLRAGLRPWLHLRVPRPRVATLLHRARDDREHDRARRQASPSPSDEQTRAWLEEQGRAEDFVELPGGSAGDFDEEEEIDLAMLVPLVAKPLQPGKCRPRRGGGGHRAGAGLGIGSSVNSSHATPRSSARC